MRAKGLFTAVGDLEPFTSDTHFTLYRQVPCGQCSFTQLTSSCNPQPFLLDQLKAKNLPNDQYGPSVFSLIINKEDKDIPLRAASEKARDGWTKAIMDACVQYARNKKQDIRLRRSMPPHIWLRCELRTSLSPCLANSIRQTLLRSSTGRLFVTVVEAADLLASDPNGKSDPFCVVKLGESQEQVTPVISNCLNPRWNHMVSP